jgi:NADP-dependent 3-hydroxy acid dehydrogenase YdfG
MIHNAGLMRQVPLERLKVDEWNGMMDLNIWHCPENVTPADSFARAVVFATSRQEDLDVSQILFRPARPGTLT